jgi:hypothetical protein
VTQLPSAAPQAKATDRGRDAEPSNKAEVPVTSANSAGTVIRLLPPYPHAQR